MRRTLLLLSLLLILLGVWWISREKKQEKIEVLTYERDFRIKEPKAVGAIELVYREKPSMRLEKRGKKWMLNDSIECWVPVVKGFLGSLRDMRVAYTPPSTANSKVLKDLETFGIDVKIFDKDQELIQAYTIGGVTPDERGTYAKKPDSDQCFVLHIPYQEGSLRRRFNLEISEWRNRFIFQEQWDEISKVTVDYAHYPDRSFVLTKEDKAEYSVMRPGENSLQTKRSISKGRAEAYLMHFEEIGIEAFENQYKKRDSVLTLQPFASVTLEKDDGEKKWIKLYPIHPQTGEVDVSEEHARTTQLFRFFGHFSSDDFVLIQHFTIGNALRSYSDFME